MKLWSLLFLLIILFGCNTEVSDTTVGSETTNGISGNIVTEKGTPVPNIEVAIRSATFAKDNSSLLKRGTSPNFLQVDTTDAHGFFEFVIEDTGSYIVLAYANDSFAVKLPVEKSDSLPITLGTSIVSATGSISGSVDFSEYPGSSIIIQILGTGSEVVLDSGTSRYDIPHVAAGVYTLRVTGIDPPGNRVESDPVTVISGEESADIVLKAGSPLFGGIVGRVKLPLGHDGSFAISIVGKTTEIVLDSTTGIFEISNLEAGKYVLRTWGVDPPREGVEKEVDVEWGVTIEDVVLELGEALDPEPYRFWQDTTTFIINTSATGADVAEDVYDFPLLIRLDLSLSSFLSLNVDGSGIRFTKSDGRTPLNFEIERWNSAGGRAEIWVKVDTLYGASDSQSIYLFTGNDTASSQSSGVNVFDTSNGFMGVWHLAELANNEPEGYRDATVNGNHGTGTNMTNYFESGGMVDRAQFFNGTSGFIEIPHNNTLNVGTGDFTLSAMVQVETISFIRKIISKYSQVNLEQGSFELEVFRDSLLVGRLSEDMAKDSLTSSTHILLHNWYQVSMQRLNGLTRLYVNGVPEASGVQANRDIDSEGDFVIGWDPGNTREYFHGVIDEVRLSKVARSAAWIALSFQNQKSGSKMITIQKSN
ncbi:MAG: DUF2341 domain-containing protein [Fibrobacteria bacterium]|nr:DUF2341 domain-containing protein [Fibrobacteria bacterium]